MAITQIIFDQYAIDNLKIKLTERLGYVLSTKPDCAKLSELLLASGEGYLSESTIYRLFFQSNKYKPYKNSLDILCRFVGFKDSVGFLEYLSVYRDILHRNGINTIDNSTNNLLYYCIEDESSRVLNRYFDSLHDAPHKIKESVILSLFDGLRKSSKTHWFFESFSKNQFVKEFFLEKGHDPKFRINHYDQSYHFYTEGIDKDRDIANLQDFIFGNSVLFRHYYINSSKENAIKIGRKLFGDNLSIEPYFKYLYIFPYMRFNAYKLWYLEMTDANQNQVEEYALYLLDLCKRIKPVFEYTEQKIIFHTIAEAFVHSNLPETFHKELKKIYFEEFKSFPDNIYTKHLKYSLPYFDQNGLIHHRP
jgi:hypothetical protein